MKYDLLEQYLLLNWGGVQCKGNAHRECTCSRVLRALCCYRGLGGDFFIYYPCGYYLAYGFNKTSVEWFRSYLSERKQQVMIGSTLSEQTTLKVGSPQGSILSPTIFIILLSDIELWCPGATLCGYADDTSVTIIDKDMDKLKTTCEEKVNELLTYMAINKLAANDDKTKILVMRHGNNKEEQTFSIGDSKVEESKEETHPSPTVVRFLV